MLYVTGPLNHAWAIDARSGRQIWHYQRQLPQGLKVCCGMVNRGFAVYGDRLFMGTLDAHFVALEMKTGKVIYDVEMADAKDGFASTGAPLVVNGKVIAGVAGGEFANRGFLDAYDPATGERVWRFYTIPAPGEPGSDSWKGEIWQRGGGPTWLTGTYDPQLNLLYWGVGNPNPDWDGESRPGDNLYTGSLVALDPDTGKLKWHYQYTPHDTHDWDANEVPVLADIAVNGRPRKVVMMANRNGFFYVNDRITGEFISGETVRADDVVERDRAGRAARDESGAASRRKPAPSRAPDWYGGTNFMSPSFDAKRGLFFVTARETCMRYIRRPLTPNAALGALTLGGNANLVRSPSSRPARCARSTRRRASASGRSRTVMPAGPAFSRPPAASSSAAITKARSSRPTRRRGRSCSSFRPGAQIFAPPTSYMLDGRQYVVIPSGTTMTAFTLPKVTFTLDR